jgi:ferric-dicitrate binding protein FerR (iron transport regulator)
MENLRLEYLLGRYLANIAEPEEEREFMELLAKPEQEELMEELLLRYFKEANPDVEPSKEAKEAILEAIFKAERRGTIVQLNRRPRIWRWVAAAAIIAFVAGGSYWLFNGKNTDEPTIISQQQASDVGPGAYKAKLTLSDGSTIILDSAKLGELARQGNTVISNKDGEIAYESQKGDVDIVYNTVSTGNGETYSFSLPDGSKVWLNSASSVYFPVAFSGQERRIETKGEVYVKVAHNPKMPFIASANGLEVLALGTEFNINAYPDEEIMSATLIEGKVKVALADEPRSGKVSSITLEPGQQTQLRSNRELTTPAKVNVEEVAAWKSGLFHFESADLKTILRQFARWYDIDVVYEGRITDRKFFVIVSRTTTLKGVLELLQDNDIVFKLEGRRLIVKSA